MLEQIRGCFVVGCKLAMNNKMKFGVASLLSLVCLNGSASASDKTGLTSGLMAAANKMNQHLPMMVDSETRLDSTLGINRTFLYKYTLVNYAAEELDSEQFKISYEERLINLVCTTKGMELFVKNNIPVTYAYYGRRGKLVTSVTVVSSQCES